MEKEQRSEDLLTTTDEQAGLYCCVSCGEHFEAYTYNDGERLEILSSPRSWKLWSTCMYTAGLFCGLLTKDRIVLNKDGSGKIINQSYSPCGPYCCSREYVFEEVSFVDIYDMRHTSDKGRVSYTHHPYLAGKLEGVGSKEVYWKGDCCVTLTGDGVRMYEAVDLVKAYIKNKKVSKGTGRKPPQELQSVVPRALQAQEGGILNNLFGGGSGGGGLDVSLVGQPSANAGSASGMQGLSKAEKRLAQARMDNDPDQVSVEIVRHMRKVGSKDGSFHVNFGENVVGDFSGNATRESMAERAVTTCFGEKEGQSILDLKTHRMVIPWSHVNAEVEEKLELALLTAQLELMEEAGFNASTQREELERVRERNERIKMVRK